PAPPTTPAPPTAPTAHKHYSTNYTASDTDKPRTSPPEKPPRVPGGLRVPGAVSARCGPAQEDAPGDRTRHGQGGQREHRGDDSKSVLESVEHEREPVAGVGDDVEDAGGRAPPRLRCEQLEVAQPLVQAQSVGAPEDDRAQDEYPDAHLCTHDRREHERRGRQQRPEDAEGAPARRRPAREQLDDEPRTERQHG